MSWAQSFFPVAVPSFLRLSLQQPSQCLLPGLRGLLGTPSLGEVGVGASAPGSAGLMTARDCFPEVAGS